MTPEIGDSMCKEASPTAAHAAGKATAESSIILRNFELRLDIPRRVRGVVCAWLALGLIVGCAGRDPKLTYLGTPNHRYYRAHATEINYPVMASRTPEELSFSQPPRTVATTTEPEPRDITLVEAIHLALQESEIIRSGGQFLSPGNSLLTNPDRIPSVYDVAINESGVLFGNRSVEAALAAFDATFTTSLIWGRNERYTNVAASPGASVRNETAEFDARLFKTLGNGGVVALSHEVNYLGTSAPGTLFPSSYDGSVSASFRQPLLAGAGVEYTSIAGPIGQSFGGISGVAQGVIIARINTDIALADFEAAVRNLIRDVEEAYWDLYLAYRNFDNARTTYEESRETWRLTEIRWRRGELSEADEAQARSQAYEAEVVVWNTQSAILSAETRLRVLLGMPPSDGYVLRPTEQPITAPILPDWYDCLSTALMNRVELRRQKWNIHSLELQLQAARSLTQPRLDVVANYRVNGFGDRLLGYNDDDVAGTPQGLNNFYETLTQGDHTGWNLGFEFNWPIGYRLAHTQVRNYEFRLLKARRVLREQEIEIGHELTNAIQEMARAHAAATAALNRYEAAALNTERVRLQFEAGTIRVDDYLRAQTRRAQAESQYFQSIVEYNKAIANLEFRRGTLLQYANVRMMEAPWTPNAYADARRRSTDRAYAWEVPWLHAEPRPFASRRPVGQVEFMRPLDQEMNGESSPVDPAAMEEAARQRFQLSPTFRPFTTGDEESGTGSPGTIEAFDLGQVLLNESPGAP